MRTRSRPRRRLLYCRRAGALQLGVVPLDAAKFDHRDDPGGHPGPGFQRLPEPPHTLEVEPATIGVAVGLFERYALGNVSAKDGVGAGQAPPGERAAQGRGDDDSAVRVDPTRRRMPVASDGSLI